MNGHISNLNTGSISRLSQGPKPNQGNTLHSNLELPSVAQDTVSLGESRNDGHGLLSAKDALALSQESSANSCKLVDMKSVPTWKKGATKATPEECETYSKQIPGWSTVNIDGTNRLRRQYPIKKFSNVVDFANKVANLAEEECHHPKISMEYGKVTVEYHTHDVGGLHMNDFIGAAKTDQLV